MTQQERRRPRTQRVTAAQMTSATAASVPAGTAHSGQERPQQPRDSQPKPADAQNADNPVSAAASGFESLGEQDHGYGKDGSWLAIKSGERVQRLATFVPRIVGEVVRDDGAGTEHVFEVEVELIAGPKATVPVPLEKLSNVTWWAARAVGYRAVVAAGQGAADKVRAAAQLLAPAGVERRTVYTHTGWREIGGQDRYLSASGALGTDGLDRTVAVDLAGPLAGFALPDPNAATADQLRAAVRASLALLDLAPDRVTAPLLAAAYRAPLGMAADGAVWLDGPPQTGKTELLALAQQHFGPGMDAKHLPGSWMSTGNALAELAFLAKDALLGVDDYAPAGTAQDVQRLARAADQLVRGSANNASRGRLTAEARMQAGKPPRAQLASTGEDLPPGASLRSRLFAADLSPGDLDWIALGEAQDQAAVGVYALAMAGYIRSLAGRRQDASGSETNLRARLTELRSRAASGATGRRTPGVVAGLALGWAQFLEYAESIGALTKEAADAVWERAWNALQEGAERQAEIQAAADPVRVHLEGLGAALSAGRAHLAGLDGGPPTRAEQFGWQVNPVHADPVGGPILVPRGDCIGWVSSEDATICYLNPVPAYNVAKANAATPLVLSEATMRRRLYEAGKLAVVGTRGGKTRLTTRVTVGSARHEVLAVKAEHLGIGGMDSVPQVPLVPQQPY